MLRLYSVSLGCPKNRVDTERVLGALGPVSTVSNPEEAELVFINTCGFIAPAVEESVRSLLKLVQRLRSLPPARRPLLAVAGCLVGRYGARTLAPDLPEVDLLLDNRDVSTWPEALREALERKKGLALPSARSADARLLSTGPAYAWLKISDGCGHACSFCTIPAIRGPLASVTKDSLRREAVFLLESGVKELIVVAQDVTSWGRDIGPEHKLQGLLEILLALPGLERLRLMYLYPAGLTKDLLRFLKECGPPFVPYFDVPLQHAAKNVLSRMGRPFAGDPWAVVERIRCFFPDAALRTSLITGFPGESETDFTELCSFVREVRFHHLGVFAYQREEGTPAADMPEQIPDGEKEWRRGALMALQKEISADILGQYAGQRLSILVDAPHEEWPGLHVGRAWFQAPESDGVTYVSGPGVIPGAMVEAEIVESADYDLVALSDAAEGQDRSSVKSGPV